MLEAQVGQLLATAFQLRNDLAAFGRKLPARRATAPRRALRNSALSAGQFGVALLQVLELLLPPPSPKRDDLGERGAVFAFQRMDQVQPLLELLQAAGSISTCPT